MDRGSKKVMQMNVMFDAITCHAQHSTATTSAPKHAHVQALFLVMMIEFLFFHILFLSQILITAGKALDKAGQGVWTRRKDAQEQQIQEDPSVAEFKLTRPPSKFVKRSPIPSQSIRRVQVLELNNGASPSAAGRIEEMKLPELKELAKTRGIKGYSKLKKSELVQLLKS